MERILIPKQVTKLQVQFHTIQKNQELLSPQQQFQLVECIKLVLRVATAMKYLLKTYSLKVMEVMLEKKETLVKLASEVTILPQLLKNVRVADKAAALNDPDVQAAGKAVDEALGNDGRLLLRQSGTEPLIRVMVEAETPEICEKYVDQVIDVLKKKGHVTES